MSKTLLEGETASAAPTRRAPGAPRRPLSPAAKAWKQVEHWIVLTHRWIGILTCLLCVMWSITGIVLIYVVQPKVMDAEYRASLNPIGWSQVHVDPTAALMASGMKGFPQRMRLEMSGGQPVYWFKDWGRGIAGVSAVDGRRITTVDADRALAIARGFAHSNKPTYMKLVKADRWTVGAQSNGNELDGNRPFHLIALHDADDRQIYVSAKTGQVVMDTSAHDRFWSWFARVPHAPDLMIERTHPQLVKWVLYVSIWLTASVLVAGMYLGIVRLSLVKRYSEGRVSPFRGWMLWHHLTGLIGGATMLVWILTAWVQMHPGKLLESSSIPKSALQTYRGHRASDFPMTAAQAGAVAPAGSIYAGFDWLTGQPLAYFGAPDGKITTFDGATGAPVRLSDARLTQAARLLVPGAPLDYAERRNEPDRYWHSFKGDVRKVPMFRVVLNDAHHTWLHIDPDTGDLLQTKQDHDRTFFLLYNELHKYDFYSLRGWPHILLVWALMLFATGISVTSVVIGLKHLTKPKPVRRK